MWHVTLAYFHCCMTLPHFLYPFSCWLTFRLFPFFFFFCIYWPCGYEQFLTVSLCLSFPGSFSPGQWYTKKCGLRTGELCLANRELVAECKSTLTVNLFNVSYPGKTFSVKQEVFFSLRGLVTNSLQLRYFAAGHCSRVCSPGAGVLGWRGCASWTSLEATELELCSSEIVSVYTPSVVSLSSSWLVSSLCQHLKSFSNV